MNRAKLFSALSETTLIGAALTVSFVLRKRRVRFAIPAGLILVALAVYFDLLEVLTGLALFEVASLSTSLLAMAVLLHSVVKYITELRVTVLEHEAILENSNDGVAFVNLRNKRVRWNESAREILGYSRENIKNITEADVIFASDEEFHKEKRTRLLREGRVQAYDTEFLRRDGKRIDVKVSSTLIKDERGSPQYIVSTFKDVTKIKSMETSLKEQNRVHVILNELMTKALQSGFNEDTYQNFLLQCAQSFPGADAGTFLLREEDGRFHYVASYNYDLKQLKKVSFDSSELLQEHCKEVTVIKDYTVDYEMDAERQEILERAGRLAELKCTLTIPIIIEGDVRMYFNLDSFKSCDIFDDSSIQEIAASFGKTVAILLWRLNLEKELVEQREMLKKLSLEDQLTGLANRRFFFECAARQLSQAKRKNEEMTVLYLDLDNFKDVNDTFGHDFGDQLLREVAFRLARTCRESDLVARLGGDEFVYLLSASGKDGAGEVSDRIRTSLSEPFFVKNKKVHLSISVGAATFPEDGQVVRALLIVADERMYLQKRNNSGKFENTKID